MNAARRAPNQPHAIRAADRARGLRGGVCCGGGRARGLSGGVCRGNGRARGLRGRACQPGCRCGSKVLAPS